MFLSYILFMPYVKITGRGNRRANIVITVMWDPHPPDEVPTVELLVISFPVAALEVQNEETKGVNLPLSLLCIFCLQVALHIQHLLPGKDGIINMRRYLSFSSIIPLYLWEKKKALCLLSQKINYSVHMEKKNVGKYCCTSQSMVPVLKMFNFKVASSVNTAMSRDFTDAADHF
ncbi:unnamed protein product [Caretta caretta]